MAGRRSPTRKAATRSSPRTRPVLASSDSQTQLDSRGPAAQPGLDSASRPVPLRRARPWDSNRVARLLFIWPTIIVVLFLSIFPLVVSLYLSLSRLTLTPSGVRIDF